MDFEGDLAVIDPVSRIEGDVEMPGDKSISHRLAMIGSIAEGITRIQNFASSADSHATLACLQRLGVRFRERGAAVEIEGKGLTGLRPPDKSLDAANSGTTVRLLSGILSACPFESTFVGDDSLSRRPMKRIMTPLRQFGARLTARDDNFLPLTVAGGVLHAIDYELPVASAQVKSSIILAGLHARGTTRVREPIPTRNHTEIALREFGARVNAEGGSVVIEGGQALAGRDVTVPGDVSSAAFFIAAALAAPAGRLRIREVGLNPTRTGFINLLEDMGARITIEGLRVGAGEPIGNVIIENSTLSGMEVRKHWIGNVIDEIPVLAVLGTQMRQGIRFHDAAELRAKETDRISAIADNLRALGVRVEEFPDGLAVPGGQTIRGGVVDSRGDHRIAMAFAVAGLFAKAPVTIRGASCVSVSFPGFFELLSRVSS
jgi:3-phosphoshikimate 1-carboxyvinyltransferase